MSVQHAISKADSLLPGVPALEGEMDPRWQAIIDVASFIETDPEAVWGFASRWGCDGNADVRDAIASCMLEHLLEYHFERFYARVSELATRNHNFVDTIVRCWRIGQAERPENAARLDAVIRECR